jgi:hypothetical protein
VTNSEGLAIAREVLGPDLTDGEVEYVMFERTGWPSFFDGDPETTFRAQLAAAKS